MTQLIVMVVAILVAVALLVLEAIWDRHLEKQWENLKGTLYSRTYWHDIKKEQ